MDNKLTIAREKAFKQMQIGIKSDVDYVEQHSNLKLKTITGLVDGKPTYASTLVFERATL